MLKIRLQRVGRRNEAAFRVVLTESTRGPKSGDNVELLGAYNPHTNEASLKKDRILYWIDNGAQVSDTVHNLLVREKTIEGKKINVLPKKSPLVKSQEEDKEKEKQEENEGEKGGESAPNDGSIETKEKEEKEETGEGSNDTPSEEEKAEGKQEEVEDAPQEEPEDGKEVEKKEV